MREKIWKTTERRGREEKKALKLGDNKETRRLWVGEKPINIRIQLCFHHIAKFEMSDTVCSIDLSVLAKAYIEINRKSMAQRRNRNKQ